MVPPRSCFPSSAWPHGGEHVRAAPVAVERSHRHGIGCSFPPARLRCRGPADVLRIRRARRRPPEGARGVGAPGQTGGHSDGPPPSVSAPVDDKVRRDGALPGVVPHPQPRGHRRRLGEGRAGEGGEGEERGGGAGKRPSASDGMMLRDERLVGAKSGSAKAMGQRRRDLSA